VALCGDILEGQALDVAVGVAVGEDVHPLLPHLLFQGRTKSQNLKFFFIVEIFGSILSLVSMLAFFKSAYNSPRLN
jgi:hypothetical protein